MDDWLKDSPPVRKNKKFIERCCRLQRKVLIDRFGNCAEDPKEELCDGCWCYNLIGGGD